MIFISEKQSRLGIAVGCIIFGLVLAVMGLLSGNQPVIKPDLNKIEESIWNNRISSDVLAKWLVDGRNDFQMVGYGMDDTKDCARFFKFYDLSQLKDLSWLRKNFKNVHLPMVVYSGDGSDSLELSAWLHYHGYQVYLLEGGYQEFVKKYVQPLDEKEMTSLENNSELKNKQLLYLYFSRNDPDSRPISNNIKLTGEATFLPDKNISAPVTTKSQSTKTETAVQEEGC